MKFYIADAFTENLFGGNPAGVVILDKGTDFPDPEVMRKTAAELRYSETAFIRQMGPAEFQIRYFTPADEVDLCGHATIASFSCLRDAGLATPGSVCLNHTLAGDLEIQVEEDFIMMEMGAPEHISTIEDTAALEELYDVMGLSYEPVHAKGTASGSADTTDVKLLPMIVSTGLPDIILPVTEREKLNSMKPDFVRLTELSRKYKAVGVHAFALCQDGAATAYCRNFAPLYDIDEEAATGTANGALTYYLYLNGLISKDSPDDDNSASDGAASNFIQGEAMGRPSCVSSVLSVSGDSVKIQVGGSAAVLAKGEIFL